MEVLSKRSERELYNATNLYRRKDFSSRTSADTRQLDRDFKTILISHLSRRQSPKAFFEPRPSEIFIRSGTPAGEREGGGRKLFNFRGKNRITVFDRSTIRRYASSPRCRRNIYHETVYQRLISRNRNNNSGKLSRVPTGRKAAGQTLATIIWGCYYTTLRKPSVLSSILSSLNPNKNVPLFDSIRHDIFIRIKRDRVPVEGPAPCLPKTFFTLLSANIRTFSKPDDGSFPLFHTRLSSRDIVSTLVRIHRP